MRKACYKINRFPQNSNLSLYHNTRGFRHTTLLKNNCITYVFLWILLNFSMQISAEYDQVTASFFSTEQGQAQRKKHSNTFLKYKPNQMTIWYDDDYEIIRQMIWLPKMKMNLKNLTRISTMDIKVSLG